ncbi:hypothetical protein VM1G_08150 [Cytospora mali]|uniref:Uncharacterized protein n=1 Tax=Cytospora mali TaxID=578113 RepID=A0A194W9M2_CYTMA|nr:hypothetical protein VM1G_08150 [Valsa mali]
MAPEMDADTAEDGAQKPQRTKTSDPSALRFIFYEPNQPSQKPVPDPRPAWEKLVDKIVGVKLSQRLQLQSMLKLLPRGNHETPIGTASRLASNLSSDQNERKVQELLAATLCFILYTSGRAAPEELDPIMRTFSSSAEKKYLDRLRRAGKAANEIIAEWAERSNGDLLYRLDCATQVVLQASLSLPQWGILNSSRSKVKGRILSYPLPNLPDAPGSTGLPILLPYLIEFLTNECISFPEICRRLGYDKIGFTEYLAELPQYKDIGAIEGPAQVYDASETGEAYASGSTQAPASSGGLGPVPCRDHGRNGETGFLHQ